MSNPAITAPWAQSDARALGHGRRERSSSRKAGSAGRGRGVGEGSATLIGTPQAKTGHSMLCPVPSPSARAYLVGVNPMTCTPAPCAMSIASTTSPYFRFGAALMKMSFAGRFSYSCCRVGPSWSFE